MYIALHIHVSSYFIGNIGVINKHMMMHRKVTEQRKQFLKRHLKYMEFYYDT